MVSLSIIYSCCLSTLLPSLFHHCGMYKEYHVFGSRILQFFATLDKIGNLIIFKRSSWRFTCLAAVFSNFLHVQFSLLSIFYVKSFVTLLTKTFFTIFLGFFWKISIETALFLMTLRYDFLNHCYWRFNKNFKFDRTDWRSED